MSWVHELHLHLESTISHLHSLLSAPKMKNPVLILGLMQQSDGLKGHTAFYDNISRTTKHHKHVPECIAFLNRDWICFRMQA